MDPLTQNDPLHIYYYNYLYSKDVNPHRTITDTKMIQNQKTGLTEFHHYVYTILKLKENRVSTPIEGNILEIPKHFKKENTTQTPLDEPDNPVPTQDYLGETQALDGLLKLGKESKIDCKITKPHLYSKHNLAPIHIPLINTHDILARQASIQAQRISRQASQHAQKLSHQVNRSGLFGKGVRVSNGVQEGVVLASYKRKGRQIRWRVVWDTGERELCYRKDLQVV